MLHIFLVILKIIGIFLLAAVGLLLILILAVLFVPIKYRIKLIAETVDTINIKSDILCTYSGALLRLRIVYDETLKWNLRLFGFRIKSGNQKSDKDIKKTTKEEEQPETDICDVKDIADKADIDEAEKYSDEMNSGNNDKSECRADESPDRKNPADENDTDKKQEKISTNNENADNKNNLNSKKKHHDKERKLSIIDKIKKKFNKLKAAVKNIKGNYRKIKRLWQDERLKASVIFVKDRLLFVLKKMRPEIKKAEFKFGTKDPALTGKILGAVCAFNGMSGQFIVARPDFEAEEVYAEGVAVLKGKIRLCHIAKLIWYYLFNKDVAYLRRKYNGK